MMAESKTNLKKEKRWDVHDHKDELYVSLFYTVYHPEKGQLCTWERETYAIVYLPIQFKTKALAYKWIESGTIAEIQEGMTCLRVGFTNLCFKEMTY